MNEHPYWLILFSFLLAGIPLVVSLCTSYIKVHIVLGMLRSGLGTQNTPGQVVIMALSLAVTSVVMEPVLQDSVRIASSIVEQGTNEQPVVKRVMGYAPVLQPWREFMIAHAGKRELEVFKRLHARNVRDPLVDSSAQTIEAIPYAVLLPAFLVSELKEGFAMACALLLPFLVIDVAVSTILVGLGMYMVSPVLITLPIKLLLFVQVDGWLLLIQGLIRSYQIGQ